MDPTPLINFGASAAALVAVAAAGRLPPVRWVFRRLVAEPADEWLDRKLDRHLEPIRTELELNHGRSVKDAVHRIEREVQEIRNTLTG